MPEPNTRARPPAARLQAAADEMLAEVAAPAAGAHHLEAGRRCLVGDGHPLPRPGVRAVLDGPDAADRRAARASSGAAITPTRDRLAAVDEHRADEAAGRAAGDSHGGVRQSADDAGGAERCRSRSRSHQQESAVGREAGALHRRPPARAARREAPRPDPAQRRAVQREDGSDAFLFRRPPPVVRARFAAAPSGSPIRRIFCVGRNYEAHAKEMGVAVDREAPFYFTKSAEHYVPSGATVPYPPGTSNYHYEMELVAAIGNAGLSHCRGRRARPRVRLRVRSGHDAPGPAVCRARTAPALGPRQGRRTVGRARRDRAGGGDRPPRAADAIELRVNGETKQSSDLSLLIHGVPEVVAHLSHVLPPAAGRPDLHRHAGRRRAREGRRSDRGLDRGRRHDHAAGRTARVGLRKLARFVLSRLLSFEAPFKAILS